ncbi:MAG: hypothetical protein RR405_02295 [Clostridia bacterium]
MSKKTYAKNGQVAPVYKDMKGRKIVLVLGLLMTIASFAIVVFAMLTLFIPNLDIKPIAGLTALAMNTYFYGIGVGLGFIGLVFTVAGANTAKGLARLSFLLGILAFLVGSAMLVITLFFKTILPIEAIQNLTGNVISLL